MHNRALISQRAYVRYRTAVLNPDGSVAKRRAWKRNLILDIGLDSVGVRSWVVNIERAAVGTGTDPTQRDSGATTFTSTGTALASSAGFFEAGDVGRLFKPDTGSEVYITAFTDTQNVTTSADPGAAATPGTIWYVDDTALQTEVKRTNTYRTSSGDNGSTWSAPNKTWTHKRTFIFTTESGPVTYREVGWSWGASPTALFGRDVLAGGGDSLVSGQQYLIVVELVVLFTPNVPTAVPDVGSGGWDTAGDSMHESIQPVATVDSPAGGSSVIGRLDAAQGEGAGTKQFSFIWASWTQQSVPSAAPVAVGNSGNTLVKNVSAQSYGTGTFVRDYIIAASVSEANQAHTGFGIGYYGDMPWTLKYTAPQTKDNVHTVTMTVRFSWQRALVN